MHFLLPIRTTTANYGVNPAISISCVNILQNYALRLMTFSHSRQHASPLYRFLNIIKFNDLITMLNVLFIYDISKSNLPPGLENTYKINFHHTTTPHHDTCSNKLGLINRNISHTYAFWINSVKNQSIELWNQCQLAFGYPCFQENNHNQLKARLLDHFSNSYWSLSLHFCHSMLFAVPLVCLSAVLSVCLLFAILFMCLSVWLYLLYCLSVLPLYWS